MSARNWQRQNVPKRVVQRLAKQYGGVSVDGGWQFPGPHEAKGFQRAFRNEQKARAARAEATGAQS